MLAVIAFPVVCHAESDTAADAETLIGEARSFDGMYCGSSREDREKAIAMYESAIGTQPGRTQTLEILFRLAQLHGTNYQISKGEKPRYGQAMRLYERIVSEYPSDEPLAMQSLICIGDICVTEWRFSDALQWYGRALEVPIDGLLQGKDALGADPDRRTEYEQMAGRIERLQFYQSSAVQATAYAANQISPSVRIGLLENLLSRHREDHIREAVARVLAKTGKVELFGLPAHLEDMPSCDEPAAGAKESGRIDAPATLDPDAVPRTAVEPGAPGSYRGIAAIILIASAGVSVFWRLVTRQSRARNP